MTNPKFSWGSMTPEKIASIYQTPIARPRTKIPDFLFSFNIPKSSLCKSRDFRSFQKGEFLGVMTRLILECFSRDCIGGSAYPCPITQFIDFLKTPDGEEKVTLCIELLKPRNRSSMEFKETDFDQIYGYRLWFFVYDSKFNMKLALDKVYEKNETLKKESKNKPIGEFERISNIDVAFQDIWNPYMRKTTPFLDLDKVDPSMSMEEILSFQRIFNDPGICQEQTTELNYFTESDEPSPRTFIKFPYPDLVYKLSRQYTDVSIMKTLPLPNNTVSQITKNFNIRDELVTELKHVRLKITEAESLGEEPSIDSKMKEVELTERISQLHEKSTYMARNIGSAPPPDEFSGDTSEEYKKWAELNEYLTLRKNNLEKLAKIQEMYEPGTREYIDAMDQYRTTAFSEFINVRDTSTNLPTPSISGRKWFNSLPPEKHFYTMNHSYKNLTSLGNFIASLQKGLDKVFELSTNFGLFFIILLAHANSARYTCKEISPNLLLGASAGAGKSFLLNILTQLAIPGHIVAVGLQTPKSWTPCQELSDMTRIYHELLSTFFDNDGDPLLKQALTEGAVSSFSVKFVPERTAEKNTTRISTVFIAATNSPLPDPTNPLSTRFLKPVINYIKRADLEGNSSSATSNSIEQDLLSRELIHNYRLLFNVLYNWEKLIETAVFPDIDMSAAEETLNFIFQELIKSGFEAPVERERKMMLGLIRSLCMLHAVWLEFFSELGYTKREACDPSDPTKPLGFIDDYYFGLLKYSSISEAAVFVVSLLQDSFVPTTPKEMCKNMASNMQNKWPPKSKKDEGTSTFFRNVENDKGVVTIERVYLEFKGAKDELISKISKANNGAIDRVTVKTLLTKLESMYTRRGAFHWIKSKLNEELVKNQEDMDLDFTSDTVRDSLGSMNINKNSADDIDRDKNFVVIRKDKPSKKNMHHAPSKHKKPSKTCKICKEYLQDEEKYYRECIECKDVSHINSCLITCYECKGFIHKDCALECQVCTIRLCIKCLKSHEDLIDISLPSNNKHIPPFERTQLLNSMSEDPESKVPIIVIEGMKSTAYVARTRICVALSFLEGSSQGIFKSIIQTALSHKALEETVQYITGSYVSRDVHTEKGTDTICFPNLFDVLTITKTDKPKLIHNQRCYYGTDKKLILGQVSSNITIPESNEHPWQRLDIGLDEYSMKMHFLRNGLDPNEKPEHMLYHNLKKWIWGLRNGTISLPPEIQNNPKVISDFNQMRNFSIEGEYPDVDVATILENIKRKKLDYDQFMNENSTENVINVTSRFGGYFDFDDSGDAPYIKKSKMEIEGEGETEKTPGFTGILDSLKSKSNEKKSPNVDFNKDTHSFFDDPQYALGDILDSPTVQPTRDLFQKCFNTASLLKTTQQQRGLRNKKC